MQDGLARGNSVAVLNLVQGRALRNDCSGEVVRTDVRHCPYRFVDSMIDGIRLAQVRPDMLTARIEQARETFSECVTVDPLIRNGVPVVKGTRVPVSLILANLAAGMSLPEIAADLNLDHGSLSLIVQSLAAAFDRPFHECSTTGRMHQLEETCEDLHTRG